jgi:hypothetical protein
MTFHFFHGLKHLFVDYSSFFYLRFHHYLSLIRVHIRLRALSADKIQGDNKYRAYMDRAFFHAAFSPPVSFALANRALFSNTYYIKSQGNNEKTIFDHIYGRSNTPFLRRKRRARGTRDLH